MCSSSRGTPETSAGRSGTNWPYVPPGDEVAERAEKDVAAPEGVHARLADDRRRERSWPRCGAGNIDRIAGAVVDDGAVGNDARVAADHAQLRRDQRAAGGGKLHLSERKN